MRFLKNLLYIKRPSTQSRLDIALILAILPHLPHLSLLMILFLLLSLIALFLKKRYNSHYLTLFMLIGALLIFISYYGELNYAGISRFGVFISLVSTTLIYAVILQRLSAKRNFYLTLSPAMLLMLSFFYYNSFSMLFYMLFSLFIFSTLLLWEVMHQNLHVVLQKSLAIFLLSLPIVVVLFLLFPRISFEKSSYGFSDDGLKRTSHDGLMSVDNSALLVPSKKIVMEILFDGAVPSSDKLYFRGSVLYSKVGDRWMPKKQLQQRSLTPLKDVDNPISYRVALYPTFKPYIYALDRSLHAKKNSSISEDGVIYAKNDIRQTLYYNLTSYLRFKDTAIDKETLALALDFNATHYPRLAKISQQLQAQTADDSFINLVQFFKKSHLGYTLHPQLSKHGIEANFLLESKEGYCVHFASAFTLLARALHIPTRVVTGFKGSKSSGYKNYLIVRELDAHAWVEVYLNHRWQRFDPTSLAAYVKDNTKESDLSALETNYLYLKHIIEDWILNYTRDKQMALVHKIANDILFALKIVSLFMLGIISIFWLWYRVSKPKASSYADRAYQKLYKKLHTLGYTLPNDYPLYHYLNSIDIEGIGEINRIYHKIRYGKDFSTEEFNQLLKKIEELN